MKNNFREVTKGVVVCGFCGLIMLPTITGYICQNSGCPDYLLEKQEHIPEQHFNTGMANLRLTTSGTAVSNTSQSIYNLSDSTNIYYGGGES